MSHRKNVLAKLDAIHQLVSDKTIKAHAFEEDGQHATTVMDGVVTALRMEPGLAWDVYLGRIRQLVGPEPTPKDEELKEQVFQVKLQLLAALQMTSDEASFELRTILDSATEELAKARMAASEAYNDDTIPRSVYQQRLLAERKATTLLLRLATALTGKPLVADEALKPFQIAGGHR